MKIINNSLENSIYMTEKVKVPPVGVEPNAFQLPDECPRLLDCRDFPVLSLITHPSDLG